MHTQTEGNPLFVTEEAAALLFGLGRAQVAVLPVDQLHNAVAILRRAFEYFSERHELDRAVAIAETSIPPQQDTAPGCLSFLPARLSWSQ